MKVRSFCALVMTGFLSMAGAAKSAYAQIGTGQIAGQVLDPKNSSVPEATITVKNERTDETRTVKTNEDGSYQVLALKPSFYTIRVSADQFGTQEQTGVQLTVGQEIHRNFTLQVASVAASITVSESIESAIDTASASMGINVNEREVSTLPLNGRQVSQLFLQSPGSVNSGTGTFGDVRFSGRAVEQNAIRYDGVEGGGIISSAPGVLNAEIPTPFRLQSSLENIQEFRVESNNFPAEYGTGTGGQISVVTKSGSNRFHGDVFEYLRNDAVDASNFFDPPGTRSKLRLNQFGASVGGPIIKDKVFFFAYYEGYRLSAGINNIEAVPSASVRALPVCAPGVQPAAAPPYGCVSSAVQPLLAGFIAPGAFLLPGASKDASRFDIYQLSGNSNVKEDSGGVRFDYRINDKHTLYARYFRDQGYNDQPEGVTGRVVHIVDIPQNGVLALSSNLSNNLINEVKVGFNEALSRIDGTAPTINGINFSAIALNLTGGVANNGIAGQGASTGVAIPGGLVRSNSATNGRGQPYTPYSVSFIDNVSWIAGRHNIKFGAEVRLVRMYTDRLGGTTFTFQNIDKFIANSLQQVQYLGDVSSPSPFNNGVASNRYLKQEYYIGYVQDEVKLRPNLTLNFGLRYEYYSPLREDRNRSVYFDINAGTLSCASPAPNCNNPARTTWYKADPANFAPRISIAWTPGQSHTGLFGGDRTVLRGGFGIYYGPGQAEDTLQPTESDRVSSTISNAVVQSFVNNPVLVLAGGNKTIAQNFIDSPTTRGYQPRAYSPEYTVPERVYQYSASWQQQWGYKLVSTVAYVGSQGRNLFLRNWGIRIVSVSPSGVVTRQFSIVNPVTGAVSNPFAEIDFKTSGGHDAYNALQTQLVRRSNAGLTLSAQYTFAKSFGNSSGSNEALTAGNPFSYDYDLGYNAFDIRHTFNVSALYELPIGHNKRYMGEANGLLQAALGNWELGVIVGARSGVPIDVRVTRPDVVFAGDPGNAAEVGKFFASTATGRTAVINTPGGGASRGVRRPDLLPGVNPFLPSGYLNPAAFAIPAPGTFGNLRRGSLHGPSYTQADLTIIKKFPIREFVNIDFRAEVYNLFNHPNFANPPATLPNALGTSTNQLQPGQAFTSGAAGSFGIFNQTLAKTVGLGANRQIQFALRLNF